MIKKFNAWTSEKFRGLSAYTLCQFLQLEYGCLWTNTDINNIIYVDLFDVFCKKATKNQLDMFALVEELVQECEWL